MKGVVLINTPTGPMSVARPVADRLLAEAVITCSHDGAFHARDAATVKAAVVGHAGICDFCSAPGPFEAFDVPDFEMPQDGWESTGGWAACATCAELVRANKRKELIDRSAAGLSFPKFTRKSVEELHRRFWQGMEDNARIGQLLSWTQHAVNGTVPPDVDPVYGKGDKLRATPLQQRRDGIKRSLDFSDAELDAALRGETTTAMKRKLLDWDRRGNKSLMHEIGKPHAPLPEGHVPHWQQALDAKFNSIVQLQKWSQESSGIEHFSESVDLNNAAAVREIAQRAETRRYMREMGFALDLKYLRSAQAYSFNAETIAAIREAASSIPHDAPLSSISTPNTGAGWFYFDEPLPIKAAVSVSEHVYALLWAWEQAPDEQPAIMFSAYVRDDRGIRLSKGSLAPATRFYWRFSDTFDEMLAHNVAAWEREYGPNSTMNHTPGGARLLKQNFVLVKQDTIDAVSGLALFFAMACVWFKQTVPVLTKEPGHVERHARKRLQREHKLTEPPTVRVVALRKSAKVAREDAPDDRQQSAREYHCRWIVKGHPRLQACGPGRKDRKLIWIEAYIAGPDDKPVKTRETVYAVVR